MILLIDNYDSFVYSLARYVGMLGYERRVARNDAVTLQDIENLAPKAIIISPGPCTPLEAGISTDVIRHFADSIPILGVCLGHQCIAEAFGGQTLRAPRPCHGKTSQTTHAGRDIFTGLPNPLRVARYHSLAVKLPPRGPLESIAGAADEDVIMAIRHKEFPVFGVQFHPESVLTEHGLDLLRNFMDIAEQHGRLRAAA